MKSKTALVLLHEGFEEIEAITPIDILRRAGVEVTIASTSHQLAVRGRSGVTVVAEILLESTEHPFYDLIVLPGGPGTKGLRVDGRVRALTKAHFDNDRLVAAICAAPTVLLDSGVLEGRQYTAHFSVEADLPNIRDEPVVVDGNLITSQGAGTALPFALALVEALVGLQTASEISASICEPAVG